jgi:transposase
MSGWMSDPPPRTAHHPDRGARRPGLFGQGHTRQLLCSRGITAVIPERRDQIEGRRRRGTKGGRPVSYDPIAYKGRNVVERSFNAFNNCRGIATRYDALTYRGAAVLAAIVIWLGHLGHTP